MKNKGAVAKPSAPHQMCSYTNSDPEGAALFGLCLPAVAGRVRILTFRGKESQGWHYDLLFIAMNLVILITHGGSYILWR